MRKLIKASVVVLFFGAMIGLGTYSFFSDEEKSEENTFTAGKLDLVVKVDSEDLRDSIFTLSDMKPGDEGEKTVKIKVEDNPACGTVKIDLKDDLDNTCTEPEIGDEANCATNPTGTEAGSGELNDAVNFGIWADDCDNVYESGEQFLTQGTLTGDLEYHIGELGTAEKCYGVQWCFGAMTVDEANHTITCDGSQLNNISQTDSFSADLVVTADQKRNQFPNGCLVDGTVNGDGDEENPQVLGAFTCSANADCDDGNPCTNDACSSGTCGHTNNVNSCDDGNMCTQFSNCSNGSCVGTDTHHYVDLNSCTWEQCDPVGGFTTTLMPLGSTCQAIGGCSGLGCRCNSSGVCVLGAVESCSSSSECNDNNACTTDNCSSGNCTHTALLCDDGNALTSDSCDSSVGCMNIPCTSPKYYDYDGDGYGTSAISCDTSSGSLYRAAQSGDCNDGNALVNPGATELCGNGIDDNCNGQVDEGLCYSIPISPNTPQGGCQSASDCNDSDSATIDSCVNGSCVNYHPLTPTFAGICASNADCNDGSPITIDQCTNGSCVNYQPNIIDQLAGLNFHVCFFGGCFDWP